VDFSPAVFFISPFSLYSSEERQSIMTSPGIPLPEKIPKRFYKYFKEESPSVRQVMNFFRAAGVAAEKKPREKRKREIVLKNIYTRMAEEDYPALKEMYLKGLTKEGYSIPGEPLKVHLYPFFFEEWVLDLIKKTEPTF
jgi:hypothetical protein